MKELIVFSIVALFIACQNPNHSTSKALPEKSAGAFATATALDAALASHSCLSQHEEALDLTKELENPTEPGIHYRPVAVTSTLATENLHAELVCSSGVTSSPEDTPHSTAQEASAALTAIEPESLSNTWETLTKKWEVVATTMSCEDQSSKLINPSCSNSPFLMEEGKMFSSDLDGSIASL